jgi:hypothetical protein
MLRRPMPPPTAPTRPPWPPEPPEYGGAALAVLGAVVMLLWLVNILYGGCYVTR